METVLSARWPTAMLTVIYTIAVIALTMWARNTALPHLGGISASEVLEGVVPGGLTMLLPLWVLLVFLTAAAWVTSFVWVTYQRRR